jgi:hypothetical protein
VAIIVTSGRILPATTQLPSATVFLGKPYQGAAMSAALGDAVAALRQGEAAG